MTFPTVVTTTTRLRQCAPAGAAILFRQALRIIGAAAHAEHCFVPELAEQSINEAIAAYQQEASRGR